MVAKVPKTARGQRDPDWKPEVYVCVVCGCENASCCIGPPAQEKTQWFCAEHAPARFWPKNRLVSEGGIIPDPTVNDFLLPEEAEALESNGGTPNERAA